MVYIMQIYCDGACRNNGRPNSVASAAIIFRKRKKIWRGRYSEILPSSERQTSQRAELYAIIIALEKALEKYRHLRVNPRLSVTIRTDSKYAYGCMTEWYKKWQVNGFTNAAGLPVANQDLVHLCLHLEEHVREHGTVRYEWIPRERNWRADRLCNEALDNW